jgi:hypothetical protein
MSPRSGADELARSGADELARSGADKRALSGAGKAGLLIVRPEPDRSVCRLGHFLDLVRSGRRQRHHRRPAAEDADA